MESYKKRFIVRELRSANNRKFAILGSGIVSHLASKLLKETIILTKKRTDIFLDNVFFHDTIENRLMLLLFGIDYTSKHIPVSYYNDIDKSTVYEVTDEIRYQIAREKMGDISKPIVLSAMTESKPNFTNLLFDERLLKKELLRNTDCVELFPDSIIEQDDCVLLYFDNDYIKVDYLINTIPQPFFNSLLSNELHSRSYQFNPLIFVTHKVDDSIEDKMIYSYNNCFWKRIFVKNSIECIEFNKEDWDEQKFKSEFHYITEYKVTEIPYGRISSVDVPDTKRIKHIGRFAQWQHSITTEHVINKLINLNV